MQKIKNCHTIGQNLRKLRKTHNLTQDDLVTRLNLLDISILRSRYARYETGELNIPPQLLVALHQIYNCPYEIFFENIEL